MRPVVPVRAYSVLVLVSIFHRISLVRPRIWDLQIVFALAVGWNDNPLDHRVSHKTQSQSTLTFTKVDSDGFLTVTQVAFQTKPQLTDAAI